MNLQRFVSSVYCENISDKEFINKLNNEVKKIDENVSYSSLVESYTLKHVPYTNEKNEVSQYILDKLFFDILFGKTIGNLYKNGSHTIVMFPVFKDVDSIKRLLPSIRDIYNPILKLKDPQFPFKQDISGNKNMYLFVPAFSDGEESLEEYSSELATYFNRAFEFILQQKQFTIGGVTQVKDTKFENICYTLDKKNQMFTSYYNKKLSTEKEKALDSAIVKFIEKLGLRLTNVKDPIVSLTKEESIRKFKADGYGKEMVKLNPFLKLLDMFTDIYKKTNDREYLKLTASSDSQSIFRLYYRVNNTDYLDTYNDIKTGSNFVYKISDPTKPDSLRVGYFIKKEGLTNQYIFREYTGLTAKFKKMENPNSESSEDTEKTQEELAEEDLDEDSKNIHIPKEFLIQTKIIENRIYFKKVTQNVTGRFRGIIEAVMNLHIYEKYKWFKFNDLSGELTPETKIKFYNNLLFDKESVMEFLKKTDRYTDKVNIGVEFLKINQDNKLLIQYVDFLLTEKEKTHVFDQERLFSGKIEYFVEKTKKAIVKMLFEPNKMIYTTNTHSGKTKEDIKKNYKVISYDYYAVKKREDLDNHFNKVITEDEEKKYCKKGKCEEIYQEIANEDVEYAIAIVDITKENIDVIPELRRKTKCKKLRKTIRKQVQPYLKKLPHVGGRSRSRSRRSKKRH